MDCIFCKISRGEIPAKILFQDNQVIAFADVNPQAPIHHIIIPKRHIATLNELDESDSLLLGHMIYTAKSLAQQENIAENGYRILMNCNAAGGQTVFHIHLHLLGGRTMTWPPG